MPDPTPSSLPARKLEDVDGEEEGGGKMGALSDIATGESARKRRKSTISKIKSCE
jgi:hypothetical protein